LSGEGNLGIKNDEGREDHNMDKHHLVSENLCLQSTLDTVASNKQVSNNTLRATIKNKSQFARVELRIINLLST
jgi:hypothetical protein